MSLFPFKVIKNNISVETIVMQMSHFQLYGCHCSPFVRLNRAVLYNFPIVFQIQLVIISFQKYSHSSELKSIVQKRYKYMSSEQENHHFSCSSSNKELKMRIFNFSRKVFRVYGLLPLDGDNFDRFKCLELLRVILLPFPTFLMGVAQLAYFFVNIRDLGKATVALYCGFGFLNSVLGYELAIYQRRKFLNLLNDMQAMVKQSKIRIRNRII